MTKEDVKLLGETDDKICWWAMVLFAEIVDVVSSGYGKDDESVVRYVRAKVEEFPRIVIQVQIEKAKQQIRTDEEIATNE